MKKIKDLQDVSGENFYPLTHINAVVDSEGNTVEDLLLGVSGTHIGTDEPEGAENLWIDTDEDMLEKEIYVPTKLNEFEDNLGTSPIHTHQQYALSTSVPTKLTDLTDDLGSTPTHTHPQYVLGNYTVVVLNSEAEYDADTANDNTLYFIKES